MDLKTLLIAALLASGTVVIGGCAHPGHEQSGSEVVSDIAITSKVKSALLMEKDVNSFDIKVNTFNGTVQLTGFVDSQWQIDKAVQVAASVNGVRSVTNDLVHKPAVGTPMGDSGTDRNPCRPRDERSRIDATASPW
ncbi:Osmotically-inducible protein Y precursor [compost metagenome]